MKNLIISALVVGFAAFSSPVIAERTAPKDMLYRFPLDGNGELSVDSVGKAVVTKSGNNTLSFPSDNKKFGSNCMNCNPIGAYVIDGIETTKADGWTLSFWFNSNGMTAWRDILAFAIGEKQGKFEKTDSDALAVYNAKNNEAEDPAAITIEPALYFTHNEWTHVAVVSTADGIAIYRGGNFITNVVVDSLSGLSKLWIGAGGYGSAKTDKTSIGLVDEVAVFNWSMTADELAYLQTSEASIGLFVNTNVEVNVSADTTLSAIEHAALGEGWEFNSRTKLAIHASNTPVVTIDKAISINQLVIDGEVTLRFNPGGSIAANSISADSSVQVDCQNLSAGEGRLLAGTIADASKFSIVNATSANFCQVRSDGVFAWARDDGRRINPVTGETNVFPVAFLGSESGHWQNVNNWRVQMTNDTIAYWGPYTETGCTKSPVLSGHGGAYWSALVDGELIDTIANRVIDADEIIEGWNAQYAFLNGVHATLSLKKIQNDGSSAKVFGTPIMFIWVDETSSLTITNSITDTSHFGKICWSVASSNGVKFARKVALVNAIDYYFKGYGSVACAAYSNNNAYAAHTIKQVDIMVDDMSMQHQVKKYPLITFLDTNIEFKWNDHVATCNDNDLSPLYSDEIPQEWNRPGTYTIKQESDGVYLYVVQKSRGFVISVR